MPRTSIEADAFGERRFYRLTQAMGWPNRMTVGTLVYLWHESQAAKRVSGTDREIVDWSWIDDPDEGRQYVEAMLAVGYLHRGEDGLLVIHGNENHIDRLKSFAQNGSAGGHAKAKAGKAKKPNDNLADARESVASASESLPSASEKLPFIHTYIHSDTHSPPSDPSSESKPAAAGRDAKTGLTPSGLVEIWNGGVVGTKMAVCQKLSADRAKAATARLREHPDPTFWTGVVKRMAASPHCCGQTTGWRADFDFLIAPGNAQRVLEGKYDPREKPLANGSAVGLRPAKQIPELTVEDLRAGK